MPPTAEDEKNGAWNGRVLRSVFFSGSHEGKCVFFGGDVYGNSLPPPTETISDGFGP